MANKNLLKILFVEDLPSDAELAIRELQKDGLQFEHLRVDTRIDFIKALNDFIPDIIISDYMLPSYNGMLALIDAREFDQSIPFILCTGSMNEETAVECIKAGANDYVIKAHLTRLPIAVKEALEQHRIQIEKRAADLLYKENEEKLQSIFRAAPVGIGLVVNRVFMEVNDTFCTMTGYIRKELIGKSVEMIYATKEEFEIVGIDTYGQIAEKGIGWVETSFKCKDERIINVLLSSTPLDKSDLTKGVTFTVMDITERKKAEEILRSSEERFKILFDYAPDAYYLNDLKGYFIDGNIACEKLMGYNKNELIGKSFLKLKLLSLIQIPRAAKLLIKNSLGQTTGPDEFELNRQDGSKVTVEIITHPVKIKGQTLILGMARDITERKRVKKILQENEEKYRRIFENVQDVYYETSIEGNILEISPSIESLSIDQYHRDDLIGKSMFDFYSDPDERAALISKLIKFGAVSDFEITLKNKNGSKVPCSISSKICLDSQGRPVKIIGSIRDITVRRSMEASIRESEKRYRELFLNNPVPTYIFDENTLEFIEVNDATVKNYGYSREEFASMTLKDIRLPEDIPDLLDSINKLGIDEYHSTNMYHRRKNGTAFPVEITSRSLPEKNERKTRLVQAIDITERLKAAEQMKLAKEKAEANDKLKTSFLNNISHEVRTPLNGILGFAEIMSQIDISEEEKRVSLSMLYESSDRLLNTITNYMDISLVNSGTVSLHKKDFLPELILRELYKKTILKCSARNLELSLEIPEHYNKSVINSDPEILKKILTHLLDNAIKFTEKGSIKYGFSVHKAELEFFIKDTGIGISKEFLERIFEHFVKEDRGPLKLSEGSGLGLPISKGLCELLGGKIRVESEEGKGSAFFFTIPAKTYPENNTSGPIEKTQKKTNKTKSILVAEDDIVNFYYLKSLLKYNTSAEIIQASNGKEAVDKFQQHPDIGLILMDVKMPVMDGLEATRHIKAINPNVPVIAITAYAMSGDESRILEAGCDYYLNKPINKKLLLEKMAEYIVI